MESTPLPLAPSFAVIVTVTFWLVTGDVADVVADTSGASVSVWAT